MTKAELLLNLVNEYADHNGWDPPSRADLAGDDGPPSEIKVSFVIGDGDGPEGGSWCEVEVECGVEVSPTEYEGGHVFYQGSVSGDNNYEFLPFKLHGKSYPRSKKFPKELLLLDLEWVGMQKEWPKIEKAVADKDFKELEGFLYSMLDKYVEEALEKYSAPSKHYPAHR
jgi:hypothetical protein